MKRALILLAMIPTMAGLAGVYAQDMSKTLQSIADKHDTKMSADFEQVHTLTGRTFKTGRELDDYISELQAISGRIKAAENAKKALEEAAKDDAE